MSESEPLFSLPKSDDTATVELPKITDEIAKDFWDSRLISFDANQSYQWTQDAVDFACLIAEKQARTIESLKVQWANSVAKANTTIAEQAARLAECERDAGRYRYLRGRPEILNALPDVRALVDDQLREEWRKAYPHGGPGAWGPTEHRHIDAAIDGAKTP